jgi:hypothetical protein
VHLFEFESPETYSVEDFEETIALQAIQIATGSRFQ